MNDSWREDQQPPDHVPDERGSMTLGRVVPWLVLVALVASAFVWRNAATSAALFLVILVGLVMAHEAGHFVMAKWFGVRVHEFGVGFPPRIWGKRYGETEYTVNWLPIGGFVRLEGEENPLGPRSLASRPRWQRLVVLGAGAGINLVLPVFLFAAALSIPHQEVEGRAVVQAVVEGSPAAEAGLREGDVIIAIGGRNAKNMPEASRLVRYFRGKNVEIEVRRDGEPLAMAVYARWVAPEGQGPTGITIAPQVVNPVDGRPYTTTVALPPWESIPQGFRMTLDTFVLARNEIVGWIKGSGGPQFAGPVGIAQTTGEVARSADSRIGAISPLLELAALLSINLGILNLLPLPMLDGGRMFFVLVEIVRGGKRIRPEREALVHLAGLALFIVLALVVTFADISRIAAGDSVFR